MKMQTIIGPPGTGKTTYCLNVVDEALARGIPPNRIAYLTFTRKAATEAITRACVKFNFKKRDFPYFKTLHALAFKQLGLKRHEVMDDAHYARLGDAIGLQFRASISEEQWYIPNDMSQDDKIRNMEALARIRMIPIEEQWLQSGDPTLNLGVLVNYAKELKRYKHEYALVDFVDMLDNYAGSLPVDLIIFDEAQDLTPQQFNLAKKLSRNAQHVLYAGDEMQAIYTWAGADVLQFEKLPGEKIVLPKSYRLPASVHKVATILEGRVKRDYERVWLPRDDKGRVTTLMELHHLDLSQGSWFLLARNQHHLKQYEELLQQVGYPYISTRNHYNTIDTREVKAVLAYTMLTAGKAVSSYFAGIVCSFIKKAEMPKQVQDTYTLAELGLTDLGDWMIALDLLPYHKREYIRSMKRNGVSLVETPRITISTIHGVKGGEADNCVVLRDMTTKTWQGFVEEPENEMRVFYTGITRARENLFVARPFTSTHFSL